MWYNKLDSKQIIEVATRDYIKVNIKSSGNFIRPEPFQYYKFYKYIRGDLEMRNISQETKDSIVNIFPKENTLAIIIFGSFGTDRATYNSDIDIAWIPTKKVPITELAIKTQSLRNVLDINVDLKIVTDNYTVELRKNIFEGDIIYQSKEFKDYLNNFYIENSDVIDILNWRDMYGS